MKEPNCRIVTITPEMAREMLDNQHPNRRCDDNNCHKYLRVLRRGRHVVHPQLGISVDKDGRVLDGQHRLWAVIKYGRPVQFWVWTTTLEIVDYMSECRTRKQADRFMILRGWGSSQSKIASAVGKLVWHRKTNGPIGISRTSFAASNDEISTMIDELETDGIRFIDLVDKAMRLYATQHSKARVINATSIAYALIDGHFLPDDAMTKHVMAIVGDDVSRTPAQIALRSRLLSNRKIESRNAELFGLIKSFNEPHLKRIELSVDFGALVPDVKDGYFSSRLFV